MGFGERAVGEEEGFEFGAEEGDGEGADGVQVGLGEGKGGGGGEEVGELGELELGGFVAC